LFACLHAPALALRDALTLNAHIKCIGCGTLARDSILYAAQAASFMRCSLAVWRSTMSSVIAIIYVLK
jgi:hypothetical protein